MVEYRVLPSNEAYRIGSDGSVWSRWKRVAMHIHAISEDWHILSPKIDNRGYRSVMLCSPNKSRRHVKVAHLVLEAFVGPRPKGLVACHGNDVKGDDSKDNLRWDTASANGKDAIKNGVGCVGESHGMTRLTESQALLVHKLRAEGKTFKKIGEVLGIAACSAHAIASGRNWKYLRGNNDEKA